MAIAERRLHYMANIGEPVKLKLSLIVLSFFSGMVDKKRKIANSFRNTSYKNKLSKVVQLV